MSLSFSGLSAYTRQEIAPLLTEAVLGAKTQMLVKQGGILLPKTKSSVAKSPGVFAVTLLLVLNPATPTIPFDAAVILPN